MKTGLWAHIRAMGILQICGAFYSAVTFTTLITLLRLGRRKGSQLTLARTTSQIYVMCGMSMTWIGRQLSDDQIDFAYPSLYQGSACLLVSKNTKVCSRYSSPRESTAACVIITLVNILAFVLSITLLGAAYAVYHRAIILHGNERLPAPGPPPLVAAWRLAHVSDTTQN
ncbi:hypothetical protein DFH09DRAFT_152041 [Mycena vulgaris]|nr:hypothetical protein DFH09DRAFT_152041 [Mycena vulgaris]